MRDEIMVKTNEHTTSPYCFFNQFIAIVYILKLVVQYREKPNHSSSYAGGRRFPDTQSTAEEINHRHLIPSIDVMGSVLSEELPNMFESFSYR